MQTIHLIELGLAATGGVIVGALAYRVHARQQIVLLQQRLLRSEEARNSANERSANAREQIAQLSKSIAELRRAHQTARSAPVVAAAPVSAEDRRAAAERALAEASSRDGPPSAPVVFAATEPMRY